MSMEISKIEKRVELLSWNEAGNPDADYITADDQHEPRFFVYRGVTYDINEGFQYITPDQSDPNLAGWEGIFTDTVFSGIVIRVLTGDDEGFLDVGLAMM